jgi:hypothetical protein
MASEPGIGTKCISTMVGPCSKGYPSLSDLRNRYLLIATDYFTKWLESYAIPSQEAAAMAEALVTNFYCLLRVPLSYIVTRAVTLSPV